MHIAHAQPWPPSRASGAQTPTPDMQRFQQMTLATRDPLATLASPPQAKVEVNSTGSEAVHSSSGSLCSVKSHRKSFRRKLADFFRWKRRKHQTLDEEGSSFERSGSYPPRRISAPVLCHISTATCPTPVLQALPVVFFENQPGVSPPAGSAGPVLPYIGYRSQLVLPDGLNPRPRALVRPQPQVSLATTTATQGQPGSRAPLVGSCCDVTECQRMSLVGSLPEEDLMLGNRDSACSALWSPSDENYEAQLSSSAYVFSLKRRRKVPRTIPRNSDSTNSDPTAHQRRSGAPFFSAPPPPVSPPPPDLPPQPAPWSIDKSCAVSSPELSPLDSPCSSDDEEMATPPSSPSAMMKLRNEDAKRKKSDTVEEVANIVEEVNRMTEELLSALHTSRLDTS